MFPGRENARGTANVNIQNFFVQIFESKRRIVEQVKQQVDLHDQHLALKCLLAGVSPPPWLCSPAIPFQTSELNKEELISGLLFPQSRPSIICPSSRLFTYQQPISFRAENAVRQDLTSLVNNPLEEQLLEEEQQNDLLDNLVRRVSNHSHEQDANIASPRDVHEEEGLPEGVSINCRENQSCLSPENCQNQRIAISLGATSPGCSQGKVDPKSVSTTGCERKPSSLGYCQGETEPSTCLDPGLPLSKMQRSKSRQKALELRSSAKASKSRSNSKYELKPSFGENIGFGIASLRSDSVSEIKLFKHDEVCQDEVENSTSQGKGGDPHQKVDLVQKSSSGDAYASTTVESLLESSHVDEMDILQSIETADEVTAKVDEQVEDPQSRSCNETASLVGGTRSKSLSQDSFERKHPQSKSCNETAYRNGGTRSKSSSQDISKRKYPQRRSCSETVYLDGVTRSKSSSQDSSKRKRPKSSNTFSVDVPSRNSNSSHWADHDVELPQVIPMTNEISMVIDAGTSIFQSETITRSRSNARGNRFKTEHSGSVECSIDVEPIDSVSSLQGGHVKELLYPYPVDVGGGHLKVSLNPSAVDVEGLVVKNITSDHQSIEKGECVDTNKCSSARKVSQTGISSDETTFAGRIHDYISKTDLLGFAESSSVELQSRHSVIKSDDETLLLKPVTVAGEALLVEEDNNGGSIEISSISKSRSLCVHDITEVGPVVVKSTLQGSGTQANLIDNSKRCDIGCGSKEVQPQGSLTKGGSNQCHERISWPRSSAIEKESANEDLSVGSDYMSADKQLELRVPSSSPGGDILNSARETVHHREEAACHNLDHYDDELQKLIGSASSDHYAVELQKMMGSASSAELRFEECYLFKQNRLMSPALLSFRPEQPSVQRSQIAPDHKVGSESQKKLPCAGETSHPLANCIVHDSDSSPVLEGFIIQTDDENQSGSKNKINHGSFQLPRTSAESAAIMDQICKSACMTTPSLHLAKKLEFAGKLDLDQSVSTELLDGMNFSQNLEGSSVFDNLGINHDYIRRSYTDGSAGGSSADARNLCVSPAEKLWNRNLQKSSSSEKRVSQTSDLPCISEENENVDEESENLCTNTPKSMSLEKRGSSIPDLPCIAEENENKSEAVSEAFDTERENVPAERNPIGNVNEDPMQFLPSVSEAKIHIDRQSLDSVNTAFSFSAKCNSVKSKVKKQNVGNQRFTGRGKENQVGAGARRNVKPPKSRFSKPKLSCNSSLTMVGPQLPEKEPKHNNIVSNITSFVPLVKQQKPAAAVITGKRDVKVKALEAAEASKRIAEQKENDRKMKKEAMKLERARQEQENLRNQEMEKKKKEEDRKKKEAEMAWKQEMEKKKKEEERKRKEFEMADRKRQREEEDKKLKEAKRQRIAGIQKQQREADQKLQAEKESKRQAMDSRRKAPKELKEDQSNAEKKRGPANSRIPEVRPKSSSSYDTDISRNSRDDDFKVISNQGKIYEESYDISPYKCSDDEGEEEDNDDNISNHKLVPTWTSKGNIDIAVISQQNRDPDIIFSAKGFCDISKIILPRKFQSR